VYNKAITGTVLGLARKKHSVGRGSFRLILQRTEKVIYVTFSNNEKETYTRLENEE
jgi:hypothetical protein